MTHLAYNLPQPNAHGPAKEMKGQFQDTEESYFNSEKQ